MTSVKQKLATYDLDKHAVTKSANFFKFRMRLVALLHTK